MFKNGFFRLQTLKEELKDVSLIVFFHDHYCSLQVLMMLSIVHWISLNLMDCNCNQFILLRKSAASVLFIVQSRVDANLLKYSVSKC